MGFFSRLFGRAEPEVEKEPKADIAFDPIAKKLKVKTYNKLFLEQVRQELGTVTDGKTDDEVIAIYEKRQALDLEDPWCQVTHHGITEDGRLNMEIDWNKAWIRLLKDHGIVGETEEEAVQIYLSLLTRNELSDDLKEELMQAEHLNDAFKDIDAEANAELKEAEQQIKQQRRQRTERVTRRNHAKAAKK